MSVNLVLCCFSEVTKDVGQSGAVLFQRGDEGCRSIWCCVVSAR